MRLPRPLRTSSFRLTVLYAAMFSVSGLVVFAIVAWLVSSFMVEQLDATVANELAEVQADAGSQDTEVLKRVITGLTVNSPGIYYLLQAPDRRVIAGNMTAIEPKPGLRSLEWTHQAPERRSIGGIRGRGVLLPDGAYLFVGISDYQLGEVREVILRTTLLGLGVTIVLAVAGGLAMSYGVLRRVEAVSRASRAIMAGDLTQRMTLRGTDDEFDHLSSSLNAMLERIQDLMLGLQQVSSDIAHDLRTPLTRLRQRLELARRREVTVDGLHVAVDGAIDNVDAILETFSALLRIAQIEAGTRRSGFQPVDLSTLLSGLIEAYQPVAEEREQSLHAQIAPDLFVVGDRELLTQMFANLIDNAVVHSAVGAEIAVEAVSGAGGIRVKVMDNGSGIPPQYRQAVLRRFYRLDRSRSTPGSGLGLSLVSAVSSLHDATLALEDNDPGLRCVLVFPTRH
ncbi:MAG TPA: ATP-binding protein [Acetobacteraceae bacterium]|nr:ATP-binding protein [Acetobacteraceae bacterium]